MIAQHNKHVENLIYIDKGHEEEIAQHNKHVENLIYIDKGHEEESSRDIETVIMPDLHEVQRIALLHLTEHKDLIASLNILNEMTQRET
ncbi:hypothetical protein ACJX0J_040765, partial [Zea mays]